MSEKKRLRITTLPGKKQVKTIQPPPLEDIFSEVGRRLSKIKNHIIVLSGKGGVGKTFISTSIAFYLARKGYKVGLFDADETGAAIPFVLGERNKDILVVQKTGELLPIEAKYGIRFLSIEPLLPTGETPLLWEGSLRTKFILDTLSLTRWGELDFMIYDMPPGTGDEVITIAQVVPQPRYGIIVSSPGIIAEGAIRRAIVFAKKMNIPLIGFVENMSYYECDDGTMIDVLGESNVKKLQEIYGIEVLERIPIDPIVREANDSGKPVFEINEESLIHKKLESLANKVLSKIESGRT